ncbi:exo-beta-N-acetylmuramidase NamZ family protein [Microbacterium sp. A93]
MIEVVESRSVATGLSRVLAQPGLIGAGRTGICTNYTGVTADLRRGVDALIDAGIALTTIFTPEHGYWGAVQAGESDGDGIDAATGIPVVDTYLCEGEKLDALLRESGVEQLLVDFQDIGVRFYTYTWTLYDLLCSAARLGIRIVVLDRPNPLGGTVRTGPGLDAANSSFVGRVSIPVQHGLTLGELGRWFNEVHVPEATGRSADFDVIELDGWNRERQNPADSWVMPSPNMPTLTTATVFPAIGLFEGTVLSEGRGTTRPFEMFGAAWTDARLAAALNERELPGVVFRESVFRPTFSKWHGDVVHGAQLHLRDATAFDPITTGITVLQTIAELYPNESLWLPANPGRPPFIDLLWGSAALREGIHAGDDQRAILASSPATPQVPASALIY